MKIPHYDYRKALPDSDVFCKKCGDVYLVDWHKGDWKLKCTYCGDIKDE